MLADIRERSSDDSLCEDEIDDNQYQYASIEEDVGGNCNPHIVRITCPDNAHYASHRSCHAEAKECARGEKFMPFACIELQDRHVGYCTAYEEKHEDSCDGDIEVPRWEAA